MECYQNGGPSSFPLSASNLPPSLTRGQPSSSTPPSRLSSPHEPLPQRASPQDCGSPLSFREIPRCHSSHEPSPRLSPQRGSARLSFHEGVSLRLSPHEGVAGHRPSSREYPSRYSHESLPRLSPHDPGLRQLPPSPANLRLSPLEQGRRLSPHEPGPPRLSPQEQHAHRTSPHDPPSHVSPQEHAHRTSPQEHAHRMPSPQEIAHRMSPRESGSRLSSHESSPRQSPRDQSPRSSPHEMGPLLAAHESAHQRRLSRDSISHLLIHEPLPRQASQESVPRVSSHESPLCQSSHDPHPNHVPSSAYHHSADSFLNHQAASHVGPDSPKLARRETDVSLNHVKLQETYINVETLEERESEKQLSQAWKRKRRRSVEATIPEYLKSAPLKRATHPLEESVVLHFVSAITEAFLTCVISVPLSLAFLLALPIAVMVKAVAALCQSSGCRGCQTCHHDYLDPHDAQFLLQDVDNHAIIHSVLIIDASMNLKRIKQLLASRVVEAKNGAGGLMYPRLTQMVSQVPGGPAWVHDHNFNLHNHVFSGPSITTEEALQKYVSSLLSQPLPPSRPLWEVIVLHDYGRSRDTVLVCRLHQCISDGMSLVRVLCQSLSDNQIMHIPQKPHFGGMTYGMNLIKAALVGPLTALTWLWWWRPELNPLTVQRGAAKPRPRVAKSAKSSCCGCNREIASSSSSEGGAYTVWGEDEGGQVVLWSAAISMSSVVRIKQVTRTCLNDVLLAALSGALRITLLREGVVHPPDLKVNLAVDLRSNTLPFTIPRLGTKAALVPLALPLSWDAAIPRLWEVRSRMDEMKASADPVVSYGLVWWAYRLLPATWAKSLLHRLHQRLSLQYSSLPGPTTSLLLGGYTVKHIYNVSPPRDPTPVSVTVLTYADQVHVSVAARRSLPSAAAITKGILCEFENQCHQMADLLANRRIPGEQRRSLVFTLSELNRTQPISDLQEKLSRVQTELQRVTQQYEAEARASYSDYYQGDEGERDEGDEGSDSSGVSSDAALIAGGRTLASSRPRTTPTSRHELATKVQSLKDEFTDLLTEIRRRKSITDGGPGVGIGVQTEFEEEDGEIRRPRKRALSTTSTWSSSSGREVSSCMARPLTTPTQMGPPLLAPTTPTMPVKGGGRAYLVTDIP